ncbi:frataxin, mitochondrial [Sitophilus oryzae]|uniref:ferroxidase n=1 Tax=Sitophilus oryzae TaxID=7048 RepID=A0A6J2XNT7_SITOR|nr:frataxin, mitochondrial [Sitophilus oryzae]
MSLLNRYLLRLLSKRKYNGSIQFNRTLSIANGSQHNIFQLIKLSQDKVIFKTDLKTCFYSVLSEEEDLVDTNTYDKVCEETLDSLAELFDEIVANESKFEKGDVVYGSGVLTIDLGNYGAYVINRQAPNRQIWLSSPTSGPKRYDYSVKNDCWIYKHDGKSLHHLLKLEFESLLGKELDLLKCKHSKL